MKPHLLAALLGFAALPLRAAEAPDFAAVFRIFDERCVECHTEEENEGGLVLETHEALMKGGESGASVEPGKSVESLLVKYLRGEVEKDGKRRFMPPGKREKLSPEEIQLIAAWIDAGAKPATGGPQMPRELNVPKIEPRVARQSAIYSLAFAAGPKLIALGRFGVVELVAADTRTAVRTLGGHKGNVNAVAFSPDGAHIFSASGENGLFGEVKQWRVADGALVRTIQAHRDTIYALAISPDGKTLATGSYDQQIKLWNAETGAEIRTLRGHNGAVFALAFRPDGKLLASASADRTVKLWDVATGQRRDTLSQPLKEQVALAWSPDGKRLAAGGFDNRIRVWAVTPEAKETTNELALARFAHEGPVLRLAWSADGRSLASAAQDGTVKLWDAGEVKERLLMEKQPDWPAALAFAGDGAVIAGRLDGTFACYDAKTGAPILAAKAEEKKPAPPPALTGVAPRGIQRGVEAKVKLIGTNLGGVTAVKALDGKLSVELLEGGSRTERWVKVSAPADLRRGSYELQAVGADGKQIAPVKLLVDDLPQAHETERTTPDAPLAMPASFWGALDKPGESDRVAIEAKAGQTLVFDLASKSLGSKADAVLSLTDAAGRVLASNNDFDRTGDPLVSYTFSKDGRYFISVSDLQFGGSADHFYRLSAGALPFVTACFPLSVPANRESEVELIGFNLPPAAKVRVKAGAPGEMALPLDAETVRSRRGFKVLVRDLPHTVEAEPNDAPASATRIAAPGAVSGRFEPFDRHAEVRRPVEPVPAENAKPDVTRRDDQRRVEQVPEVSPLAPIIPSAAAPAQHHRADFDLFSFEAKAGSTWAIETQAAQRGSPADTRIEVLARDGKPVERLLLQAVRDSAITFRSIDSVTTDTRVENWQEMGLNQLLYMSGEVAKIFRMPEGPDSGFQFYKNNGRRTAYFNTTATAHALDEPCYIVEPHPPGAKLASNGLPVFPLFYANDDDGERELDTDSRLLFTAPADGTYLVRVSDSRGLGGERFVYELIVREAKPDFSVRIDGANPTVNAGSGQGFTLVADRKDGFEGDIAVEIRGVPAGWKVTTPLVIEAGHHEARGAITALPEAKTLTDAEAAAITVTATATIDGKPVAHDVGKLGKLTLGAAPKVVVALEPAAPGDTVQRVSAATPMFAQDPARPLEITIAPGEAIPAWVKIKRKGHDAELRFDVENLPHGVIVDNLGLNGITLLAGQDTGEIHLKAEPWVAEMDRLCFAITRGLGNQTSLPVLLHVRKKDGAKVVTAQ